MHVAMKIVNSTYWCVSTHLFINFLNINKITILCPELLFFFLFLTIFRYFFTRIRCWSPRCSPLCGSCTCYRARIRWESIQWKPCRWKKTTIRWDVERIICIEKRIIQVQRISIIPFGSCNHFLWRRNLARLSVKIRGWLWTWWRRDRVIEEAFCILKQTFFGCFAVQFLVKTFSYVN